VTWNYRVQGLESPGMQRPYVRTGTAWLQGIPETEYGHIGGGSASEPVGDKKVYIRSCATMVPWYHSEVESRKSKVEKNAVIVTFVM
jgi:hypothetical protein